MYPDPSFPRLLYEERLRTADAARIATIVRGMHEFRVRQVAGELLIRAGLWLWLEDCLAEPSPPAANHPH